jgi:hypothetical protein
VADRQLFDRPDASHRFHDLLLIAAFAAGDADPGDARRAGDLAAGCLECASLVDDLRAIAAATASIPVPPRPRDYRLSAADAHRLRPHGFARMRAAFDGRRLQLARPLATGLTMLGLAGIIVSSVPSFSPGGSSAGQAPYQASSGAAEASGQLPPELQGQMASPPAASERVVEADASADGTDADNRDDPSLAAVANSATPTPDPVVSAPAPRAQTGPTPIMVASVAVLALGLVLLAASTMRTRAARR